MTINKQTTIGAFVLGGIILALCAVIFFSNFNLFSKEHAIIVFQAQYQDYPLERLLRSEEHR